MLKKSLAQLEPKSQKAMAYFFATLFVQHPELRPMFPLALDAHRQRVFEALARYAWASDRPESLDGWLAELARAHRKFGVQEDHFRPFCEALLVALRAFGDGASPEQSQAAWRCALDRIAATMASAVHDARDEPAWWLAEVVGHERRGPGLAVVTLHPDEPFDYRAGQHVSVQVARWPRVWREYSIANAPAPDGLMRLHVRAVPCGLVSTALVQQTAPGDTVILGPARGEMTADAVSDSAPHAAAGPGDDDAADPASGGEAPDPASGGGIGPAYGGVAVACFAGGTGLAPIKAILQELTGPAGLPRPVGGIRLYLGARTEADFYDLPDLRHLAKVCPSLTVVPVVSDDPGYAGLRGTLAQAAADHLPDGVAEVFVSGPPDMVRATVQVVADRAPDARIHFDPPPGPAPLTCPAGQPTLALHRGTGRARSARRAGPAPWQPQG